jgi:beta-phosphoglucomutase-like phosphatase (HAD superfamily)
MSVLEQEDRRIKALILDMDGLLVDTEHLAAMALERFLGRHGRTMIPGTMEQTLGRRLPEAIAIVAANYALSQPLPALIEEYGGLRLEALRGNVRPMPGARELVVWGRSVGIPMALATSSRRSHAALLSARPAFPVFSRSRSPGRRWSRANRTRKSS